MSESKTDIEHGRTSRRALLTAAAGGLGAWVAAGLGRAAPVAAADGDIVNVGDSLTGSKTTVFNVNTGGYSALWGNSTAASGVSVGVRGDAASSSSSAAGILGNAPHGAGVHGTGSTGVTGVGTTWGVVGRSPVYGVMGTGDSAGVLAQSSSGPAVLAFGNEKGAIVGVNDNQGIGVIGFSHFLEDSQPIPTYKPSTGVYGEARRDGTSRGVWGASEAGQGVRGDATTGVGVSGNASTPAGYAFRGSGRVRFDKVSGVATIPAGATSVTVTPGVDVTADSFVLLTAKANIGSRSLYFSTDATNNRITIRLSSSRPSGTAVAWLLMR